MGVGVVGLGLYGVFVAKVGGVPVAFVLVELAYLDIFGLALVGGLKVADLLKLAAASVLGRRGRRI